jgi:type I restriction enzyme, S subunit
MTDAAPRDLPDGWKSARLGDHIARPEYGYTASATIEPIGPKFLRITDIQDGRVDWNSVPYCKLDGDVKRQYLLQPGDIVVARIGATTGKSFLISECPETAFASYLIRIRTQENLSSDFLNLFFETAEYWKQINENKGGRLKGGVNILILQSLNLPFPPLPEQRAIAHALRAAQQARAARQRGLTLERERKAALMEYLFTRGTRNEPRKQTEIGEMPESWRVVTVGETGEIITGTTPRTEVRDYYGQEYMFISPGDIGDGKDITKTQKYLSEKGLKVSRTLPSRSVLVVCIGATIGKTAMTSAERSATNQQINAIIPNISLVPDFLYYALNYRSRALPAFAGRAAVPIVNKSNFAKFEINVAPFEEQHNIAVALCACDAKITALEREVAVLDELFRAMLDELMTGKLRVKE